jgi:predicted DNA-binding protein (UPF0278 family)
MTVTRLDPADFHRRNCRSYLEISMHWINAREWDRAIDVLRAAFRAAVRADMLDTSGHILVAIIRCKQAAGFYGGDMRWVA